MFKFLHMADMHFDASFTVLHSRANLGMLRRLDQRNIFSSIIDRIKKENINYFFISGDLYEQKNVKPSTIDFINSKFQEIPHTRIFIAPGNHDPFIKNSFYNTYNWANNVKIFGNSLEKVELPEVNIYGFGFTDYNSSVEINVNLDKNKPNILVMHASLDGKDEYNPIPSAFLRQCGFDYVALGHIHKTNFDVNSNILYSGSPLAMGFDEIGIHGVIEGIFSDGLHLNFAETDNKEFMEQFVDISNMNSTENLLEELNSIYFDDNVIYKIVLTGKKNFSLPNNLLDYLPNNVVKIKDNTGADYDFEAIARENSLKGLFVRNLLKKLPENKEVALKALEIGLELF